MPEWLIELLKLVGVFSSGGLVVAILKRKWEKSDRKDDVRAELEKIRTQISDLKSFFISEITSDRKNTEEYRARQSRARILQFNDELIRKIKHTRESFDDVISEVDHYEDYCLKNPEFPNFKAVSAIENIKRVYKKCMEEGDFLQ